ncbi:hypothetical protein ACGFSD_28510 [Streptomyces caniferus]|uniref:hypothetical protein n=1 Tax=Streptomyces caniferus TaxID=285557 RepID=UPI0037109D9D
MVEALARALRLPPDERAYLFHLAPQRPRDADKHATVAPPPLPGWSPTCHRCPPC